MSSRMYVHNGLDPEIILHLQKTYVLPVLLYGLELVLSSKILINFWRTRLKRIYKTVNKYWQSDVSTPSAYYSTLECLNMESYKLGTIHPPIKNQFTLVTRFGYLQNFD